MITGMESLHINQVSLEKSSPPIQYTVINNYHGQTFAEKKAAIQFTVQNDTILQLDIYYANGRWLPAVVRHAKDGKECVICKQKLFFAWCFEFEQHLDALFKTLTLHPAVRLKLLTI